MLKDCKQSKQIECREQCCAHCGWNPEEDAKRRDLIRRGGMSKVKRGQIATLHLEQRQELGGLSGRVDA